MQSVRSPDESIGEDSTLAITWSRCTGVALGLTGCRTAASLRSGHPTTDEKLCDCVHVVDMADAHVMVLEYRKGREARPC